MATHHIDRVLSDPLSIIDGALNTLVGFAKPNIVNAKGGGKGNMSAESYYRNYTPPKGTINNPLKGKEIKVRFKSRK